MENDQSSEVATGIDSDSDVLLVASTDVLYICSMWWKIDMDGEQHNEQSSWQMSSPVRHGKWAVSDIDQGKTCS